jgi:hypothetical protein
LDDFNSNRITRILTSKFPQYFAVITRIRQEAHVIGPEGDMISSTVVPQVQAIFPEGALTKKIKVGLQVGNSDHIEVIEPMEGINDINKKKRGFFSNFGDGFKKRFSKRQKQIDNELVPQKIIKKDKSTQTDKIKKQNNKKLVRTAPKENRFRPPPNGGCLANLVIATVPNLDLFSRMI